MGPTSQSAPGQQHTVGDATYLPNTNDHEIPLSPASREIIEKCTVSAAATASSKDARVIPTMISRPPSSGRDIAGFRFAKPSHPTHSFSARSHPKTSVINTVIRDLHARKGSILGDDISNIKDVRSAVK
jgi:hypothetical protein